MREHVIVRATRVIDPDPRVIAEAKHDPRFIFLSEAELNAQSISLFVTRVFRRIRRRRRL